jgi:trigger factor
MNHSIETLSDTRAKVVVTISGEEVTQQDRAALQAVSSQARVPGFRPGKAPENLLRSRYGKQIAEETKRRCISSAYEYARDKSGLKIFALVDVTEGDVAAGKEAAPEFVFDVQPKIDLPEYTGIETVVRPYSVTDADVEAEVENIRRARATYTPVEREAKDGDYVKLTYKGTIDGKPIAEMTDRKIWGTQENTWEEARESSTNVFGVPAIVSGIIGMKAGDEKDLDQFFDDLHEAEALRGKKGVYHVTVHEVRERTLPELNDEFLKSIGAESAEKLRERIRTELEGRKKYERRTHQREQITKKLMSAAQFEVPQAAIDQEAEAVVQRVMLENMQRGVPESEFEKHLEEVKAKAVEVGKIQAKRNFLIGEIAAKEKVQITNEDLNRAITLQAMRLRMRPEEFVKELQKDRDAIRIMQRDIVLDKTMEHLVDLAKVTESADAPESAEPEHDHDHDEDKSEGKAEEKKPAKKKAAKAEKSEKTEKAEKAESSGETAHAAPAKRAKKAAKKSE